MITTFILAAALSCSPPRVVGQIRLDQVIAVDGDTLKAASGQRYRIWGVNSVERGEAGYSEATRALHEITRETLSCFIIDQDKYQRPVVRCFNSRGDVASQLIATGTVVDWPRYSRQFYGPACWGGWR